MKNLAITGILAASFLLFASSRADAALQIALQQAGVNGGAITVVASGADFTSAAFGGTYGDFTVQVFGGASSNTASLSDLLSSTTRVTNNSGSTATLNLYVTQSNYTLPVGTPLNVESGMGGSVNVGTVGLTGIFQAYADANNNLFGIADFTNGPQNATQSGSSFDTGSAIGLFNRTGNYSLTSVVRFTLSGGGQANYSSHVNVTAVPEPGSMLLLGSGLFGLAGAARRRLKKAAQ